MHLLFSWSQWFSCGRGHGEINRFGIESVLVPPKLNIFRDCLPKTNNVCIYASLKALLVSEIRGATNKWTDIVDLIGR
jgi:hypothetical protein